MNNRERILVVATREIGDVLLVTPLLRSLKQAFPKAGIDVLAFRGKAGMLEGNRDVADVIEVSQSPPLGEFVLLLRRLWRSYDTAVTVQPGDRQMIITWAAAPRRVGLVFSMRKREAWKRWMLNAWVLLDNVGTHTVVQNLALADALGIDAKPGVVPPRSDGVGTNLRDLLGFDHQTIPFVVLHPFPRWRYKQWPEDRWRDVGDYVNRLGFRVVLTGGPSDAEQSGCSRLAERLDFQVENLAGQLTLADLTDLYERAAAYVGPDTATTHLAAACGCPTVAIYGPSNPMKWGPWPKAIEITTGLRTTYRNRAAVQQVGNVWLLQPQNDCVPCYEEGCDRHRTSHADCLDRFSAKPVLEALAEILEDRGGAH